MHLHVHGSIQRSFNYIGVCNCSGWSADAGSLETDGGRSAPVDGAGVGGLHPDRHHGHDVIQVGGVDPLAASVLVARLHHARGAAARALESTNGAASQQLESSSVNGATRLDEEGNESIGLDEMQRGAELCGDVCS